MRRALAARQEENQKAESKEILHSPHDKSPIFNNNVDGRTAGISLERIYVELWRLKYRNLG
jgi:hypothetical protein